MFNFKKKKKSNNSENIININVYKEFKEEMMKFGEYDLSDVTSDERFWFIYRSMKKNIKNTLILASYLRQIEVPLEVIKKVYSLDDKYIENLIKSEVPLLRVNACKRLEELPNETVVFLPGVHNNFEPLYVELIDRIEYFLEIERNQNKLQKELANRNVIFSILNNPSLLVLLNYFSVKESLIFASVLGILDIDEGVIQQIYSFDQNDFRMIFDSVNTEYIKDLLIKRIEKLRSIEIKVWSFDYDELADQYEDLLNKINDTKGFFTGIKK